MRAVGPTDDGQFIWDLGVVVAGVCATGQLYNDDSGDSYGYALKLGLDGKVRSERSIAGGCYKACGIDGDGRGPWPGTTAATSRCGASAPWAARRARRPGTGAT